MIKLEFTEKDKELLSYWRFNHPHPRVQLKMEVLWLKSQGLSNQKIVKFAGVSVNTVTSYSRDYQEGGIEKLKEIKFNRPKSELKKHQRTIEEYFESNPPATINEAVKIIEELTGIKRSPTQVRKFLKSIGMRCLKVGIIPSKVDVEAQDKYSAVLSEKDCFLEIKTLNALMSKRLSNKTKIFTHLVVTMQGFQS